MLQEQASHKETSHLPAVYAIKPSHYRLSIFNIQIGGTWKYDGVVQIDAQATETVSQIVLNSGRVDILTSEVFVGLEQTPRKISASTAVCREADKQICVSLSEAIAPGGVRLVIAFQGHIDNSMTGFYRATYSPDVASSSSSVVVENKHWLLTTHFEPCYAREAFPCFDEPHMKATFDLDLELSEDLTALSNMPQKSVQILTGEKKGLKRVCFETTPVMSTYLAAWAIGDFEYVEALTKRIYDGKRLPVRVYTTKGLTKYAQFAVQEASRYLDYFSDIFGVDYPLPKCDHLVVHEFISGAMENWGLITYKPTKILFDADTSDNRLMSKASYVIAHELAHQWFGNLVTMSSWKELWLNEGFATWAGYLAMNHFHPEWNIWGQFVDEAMQEALDLDSLAASHAIETMVGNDRDVRQMFDSINYFKGSSIIRMLVTYVGEGAFLQGIAEYLRASAHANATSEELWKALAQSSGVDVKAMMEAWILEVGFPMVSVETASPHAKVKQRPFPRCSDEADTRKTLWHVPLGVWGASSAQNRAMLDSESAVMAQSDSVFKLNRYHTGFFRTEYSTGHLASLTQSCASLGLSTEDQVGLISDMAALVLGGLRPTGDLLNLLQAFSTQRDCFVWSQIKKSLAMVSAVVTGDDRIAAGFAKYTQTLVRPVKGEISWTGHADSYVRGELEKMVIQVCVIAKQQDVLQEIRQRFQRWAQGDSAAINRNLQAVIFGVAVAQGAEAEYETVKAEYIRNHTIDGREICLTALGCTPVPVLARDLLEFAFSPAREVPVQNLHMLAAALGGNGSCNRVLWDFVQQEWDTVYTTLRHNDVALTWFVENGLGAFASLDVEQALAAFFEAKNIVELERPVSIVRERIRRNTAYREGAGPGLAEWLQANGFM
ncbi:hypothetical protein A1O1_06747 [Capronia coronata CBS 617.96]|uniref:Aminopeptidase n=1 Tax=Capronia coronata CBS 617.96 TaxID=1182541 RepID=W9XSB3_9EURO|nr:uncharacterized protein A1O1_06747 [Capronia coronata CBS 617.96]EXJ83128.1 hypothetical protein A1O1_06747 [Capronia coronata CBS 617.96]